MNQPETGFGFSNFRVEPTLPDSINRTQRDIQYEPVRQWTNPIRQMEHERHSDFLFRDKYKDYQLIEEQEPNKDYIYWDTTKNLIERTPMSDFFFSKKNLDHLQNLLIQMVYYQSDKEYILSRQSDEEMLTVMRSVYLSTPINPYATGKDFKLEIAKLNKNVLNIVVPKVLVAVQGYLGYVRDQGSTVYPNERPQNMSNAGLRTSSGGFTFNFI